MDSIYSKPPFSLSIGVIELNFDFVMMLKSGDWRAPMLFRPTLI